MNFCVERRREEVVVVVEEVEEEVVVVVENKFKFKVMRTIDNNRAKGKHNAM